MCILEDVDFIDALDLLLLRLNIILNNGRLLSLPLEEAATLSHIAKQCVE